MSSENHRSETARGTLRRRIAALLIELATFREVRQSNREGRNQLRVAVGLGLIAATGFSVSRLIDPATQTLGYWWWTNLFCAMLSIRATIWLFLTIEGGGE